MAAWLPYTRRHQAGLDPVDDVQPSFNHSQNRAWVLAAFAASGSGDGQLSPNPVALLLPRTTGTQTGRQRRRADFSFGSEAGESRTAAASARAATDQ
jgi:hypothetical protein